MPKKKPNFCLPRFLVAASGSGIGKTSLTLGLLQALTNRGLGVAAFKAGPDYIDPLFHQAVLGIPSRNLDLFLSPPAAVKTALARGCEGQDIAVIEGVMGFYDGIGGGEAASTYQLARLTRTPVVLLLDARGSCLSLAATLQGFRDFRPDNGIAGVVLNRASPRQEEKLPPILWRETGITVFGALPDLPEARLESRHLGLVTPAEVPERQEKMQLLASLVTKHLDLVDFLAVAAGADDLVVPKEPSYPVLPSRPRLGVALDAAFAFYYQDNLDLLRHFGAELVFFSPLADPTLPPDLAGLYFGGGYPELHARELAENVSLREEIRSRVKEGMPVLAECGGFLYLQTGLGDPEGQVHPMLGVLPGVSQPGDKPGLFGYLSLTAKKDNLLCRKGGVLRGHSFHYWQTSHPGSDWRFTRADGSQTGEAGWATPSLFASFTHIHFASNPTAAQRLVAAAAAWRT